MRRMQVGRVVVICPTWRLRGTGKGTTKAIQSGLENKRPQPRDEAHLKEPKLQYPNSVLSYPNQSTQKPM